MRLFLSGCFGPFGYSRRPDHTKEWLARAMRRVIGIIIVGAGMKVHIRQWPP